MPVTINEDLLKHSMEMEAQGYAKKYENIFRDVSSAQIFSESRPFTMNDAYALGKQLDQYKAYESYVMNEAGASASDLGTLPNIAMDLVAATYGTSIEPLFCSMQNLEDQQGLIYFKQVIAGSTRRGTTAGDIFADAKRGIVSDFSNYSGESVVGELVGTGNGSATTFSGTLANAPIRQNNPVKVYTTGRATAELQGIFDPATGALLSIGGWTGTLNYATGAISVTTSAALTNLATIKVDYQADFEQATDIPDINMTLATDNVFAEIMALKQPITTFKAFAFNKRFGKVAEDEALADLTGAMADISSRRVIAEIVKLAAVNNANADLPGVTGAVTFDCTAPANVSEFEHRQSFKYTLNKVDAQINKAAGRGVVNRYIGGYGFCLYMASLPGFKVAPNNQAVGPHVYGYLDGIPVVRTKYIADATGYGIYLNPTSPFDAPLVCGTFMPVFVTSTIQNGVNPFRNQRAIAQWKSYKGVVGQYVRQITLSNLVA